MPLSCFPPAVPRPGAPFPPLGSRGSVPQTPRYYEALRRPAARPAAVRSPSGCGPTSVRPLFAPHTVGRDRLQPGTWSPGFPTGVSGGNDRASHVPGEPLCLRPALRPRRDRLVRPLRRVDAVAVRLTTTTPAMWCFRGSITRPQHSLSYASPTGLPRPTPDSLPAAGPALRGGIGYPLGSSERFPKMMRSPSPFPKLSWRNNRSSRCAKFWPG